VTFSETLVFYLVIGLGVAAAQWSVGRVENPLGRNLAALAAVPFWPLFLPLLLSSDRRLGEPAAARSAPVDDLARNIDYVEAELQMALSSLAEGPTAATVSDWRPADRRLAELHDALTSQADRIRRMDEVLARSGPEQIAPEELCGVGLSGVGTAADSATAPGSPEIERDRASRAARRANLRRLAELRRTAEAELRANVDRIRELVSQVHLVEFSGAPPGRAQELLAEIAAIVEKMVPRV
jgi:hypothetical protein